jgi:hypothetical protein
MLPKLITRTFLRIPVGVVIALAIGIGVVLSFADDMYAAAVTQFLGCQAGKTASIAANNLKGQWVLSAHSTLKNGKRIIEAASGTCSLTDACSKSKGFAPVARPWAFVKASASHSTPKIIAARCT